MPLAALGPRALPAPPSRMPSASQMRTRGLAELQLLSGRHPLQTDGHWSVHYSHLNSGVCPEPADDFCSSALAHPLPTTPHPTAEGSFNNDVQVVLLAHWNPPLAFHRIKPRPNGSLPRHCPAGLSPRVFLRLASRAPATVKTTTATPLLSLLGSYQDYPKLTVSPLFPTHRPSGGGFSILTISPEMAVFRRFLLSLNLSYNLAPNI